MMMIELVERSTIGMKGEAPEKSCLSIYGYRNDEYS